VRVPRKTKSDKKVYLNMNIYRNLHHYTNNQAKVIYRNLMFEQLHNVKIKTPIEISFRYFKGTKRKSDKANVLSIVEKFFCDALIHYGCIEDDNDDIIKTTVYLPTVYDKGNARVEIAVKEIK
jgi:hypothetical protein